MTDRDEALVRYVLDVAETKEQDAAWEAFNRITSELAEAREANTKLIAIIRGVHGNLLDDRINEAMKRKP